jgi:tetratricopeptide (TPR) repeat protein
MQQLAGAAAAAPPRAAAARTRRTRAEPLPATAAHRRRAPPPPTATSHPAAADVAAHAAAPPLRRRDALALALGALTAALASTPSAALAAAAEDASAAELEPIFAEALAAASANDYTAADAAWTRAVAAAPRSAAALSNRGAARLQAGRWAEARDDLAKAVALDAEAGAPADALVLNNLGNARGACGDWDGALVAYADAAAAADAAGGAGVRGAARSGGARAVARANTALALFQTAQDADALRVARALLRRDPEFWDMRAAAASFLWASGDEAGAEAEWNTLCASGRGFGASRSAEPAPGEDASRLAYSARLFTQQMEQVSGIVAGRVRDSGGDTPCALYRNTATVAPRWPPRATAALDAFLKLRREGEAKGYDGVVATYTFAQAGAAAAAR